MRRITTLLLFSLAAICAVLLITPSLSRAQQMHDTRITWQPPVDLGSCADVDFSTQLSNMPGVDGKQHVRLIVKNRNAFAVNINLKARFESSEGDKYESNSSGSGVLNGGREAMPNMLAWLPFDLRVGDNPEVARMGLFDVEIRNWDKDDSPPSDAKHYTRGTLISQACRFEMTTVATKKAPAGSGASPVVGCWKLFGYSDNQPTTGSIDYVFRADGSFDAPFMTGENGNVIKLQPAPSNPRWRLNGDRLETYNDNGLITAFKFDGQYISETNDDGSRIYRRGTKTLCN